MNLKDLPLDDLIEQMRETIEFLGGDGSSRTPRVSLPAEQAANPAALTRYLMDAVYQLGVRLSKEPGLRDKQQVKDLLKWNAAFAQMELKHLTAYIYQLENDLMSERYDQDYTGAWLGRSKVEFLADLFSFLRDDAAFVERLEELDEQIRRRIELGDNPSQTNSEVPASHWWWHS